MACIFTGKPIRVVFSLAILLFCANAACAQNAGTEKKILLGEKSWEQWKSEAGWESYSADDFQPSETKIRDISELSKKSKPMFLVFGGSWCPDTEMQLPMIFKILQLASIPADDVHLYGVDRQKTEPTGAAAQYNIRKVPTLIVLTRQAEAGKIEEFPETTWEDDILKILSK